MPERKHPQAGPFGLPAVDVLAAGGVRKKGKLGVRLGGLVLTGLTLRLAHSGCSSVALAQPRGKIKEIWFTRP